MKEKYFVYIFVSEMNQLQVENIGRIGEEVSAVWKYETARFIGKAFLEECLGGSSEKYRYY